MAKDEADAVSKALETAKTVARRTLLREKRSAIQWESAKLKIDWLN